MFENWQEQVSDPFRRFAMRDIRTLPIALHVLWNWWAPNPRLRSLESRYYRGLMSAANLFDGEARLSGQA